MIDFTQPVSELMSVGPTDANDNFQDAHQCGMAIETFAQPGPILCKVRFPQADGQLLPELVVNLFLALATAAGAMSCALPSGLADCASRLARSASYTWGVFIHN